MRILAVKTVALQWFDSFEFYRALQTEIKSTWKDTFKCLKNLSYVA